MGFYQNKSLLMVQLRDTCQKRPAGPAHLYHITGSLEDDWMVPQDGGWDLEFSLGPLPSCLGN